MLGLAIAAAPRAAPVRAADILAEPPSDLIVTVYRAPFRDGGSIVLDDLQGFALISETRTVHLPAGRSRLRFEGVADGIEPASAIVTGFPGGVIEKNRDARLLSPSALVDSTLGKPVDLLRTIRKTGKTERLTGTLLSGGSGTVIGAFVIGILSDGLVMMGVSSFWQTVIKGLVIIAAVVVDQAQRRLQQRVALWQMAKVA